MKSYIILFTLMVLSGISLINAQDAESKEVKRMLISDVYIQGGFLSENNPIGTITDFNKLAPHSVLLNGDLSGYSTAGFYSSTSNGILSMALSIKFSDKEKKSYRSNPLLRLGFSYSSGTSLAAGLYNKEQKPFDTLTSSQTGQVTYVDSVIDRNIGMNYSSNQIRFDASLIFRTNPMARWSLYGGIGVTTGVSINAYTDIYYNKVAGTQNKTGNGSAYDPSFYSNNYAFIRERIINKNNIAASAFIPMGLDFRIGRKNEFWKRMHIFYELRPGINVTSIPELRTITNACVQMGLGIKVSVQ